MTKQPYAGFYFFHLMLEQFTDNAMVAKMAYENMTDFDFVIHMSLLDESIHEIGIETYFDINRRMKLEEKFNDDECVSLLYETLDKMIELSQ